jgi:hypothetical protein
MYRQHTRSLHPRCRKVWLTRNDYFYYY